MILTAVRESVHTPSARMFCIVIQAHFCVNCRTCVFVFVLRHFSVIRDDEKESWIMRQGKLDANKAKPYTVHIGHGVNRSANHLQFISQISNDPIGMFKGKER